jgi:hypothetical protein
LTEDENNTIETDNLHNCQTSSEDLIIIDGSDKECRNTDRLVNKSACKKNAKVAKINKGKNKVNHVVITLALLCSYHKG